MLAQGPQAPGGVKDYCFNRVTLSMDGMGHFMHFEALCWECVRFCFTSSEDDVTFRGRGQNRRTSMPLTRSTPGPWRLLLSASLPIRWPDTSPAPCREPNHVSWGRILNKESLSVTILTVWLPGFGYKLGIVQTTAYKLHLYFYANFLMITLVTAQSDP
jgi:hypothetical protein